MSAPSLVERLKACAVSSRAHGQDNSARHFDEAAARITTLESALYGQTFSADPRDARIAELEAENALLRDHIAEQITHVETRIQDGRELGAKVWRIALEDVVRENLAALHPEKRDG